MKILIADDSIFMRTMIKNILNKKGISEVIEAVDGQDAVDKVRIENPNLVFLDIMMPNKTGIEALKEIKSINQEIKVIMCTSVGNDKAIEQTVDNGAEDYVTKPFKEEDIDEILTSYANL